MTETLDNKPSQLTFSNIELARQLLVNATATFTESQIHSVFTINTRGNTVFIQGDHIAAKLAENILNQLYDLLKNGYPVYSKDVDYAIRVLSSDDRIHLKDIFLDTIYVTSKKHAITPKSRSQKEYIDAIRSYDMVFGIGPAGTGKTYLAMAMAVSALSKGQVSRIILTRPAVEAGEALDFCPEILQKKLILT